MPNPFEIAGSQHPESLHKAVPLATTQIFSGYWPNSAPYHDAAVPYLYSVFYGASRRDKIIAGLNTEISPQMTLIRRPGNPVWNSNTFTNVIGFYPFKPFEAAIGEQVYVIVDTATAVYIAGVNGTPVKTLLYTKASGAGPSRFQGEGNTLYWGDGVSTKKWSWFPAWTASNSYALGFAILDSNNNIQQSLGYGVQIVSTSVSSNIATINYTGAGVINEGDTVTLYGLTTKTSLNTSTQQVLSAGSGFFTITYVTGNYGTTSDTGVVVDTTQGFGISGSSSPSFSGTIFSTVLDNTNIWVSWGNAVQNMGIVAPVTAPGVQVTSVPAAPSWAATTYYWPQPFIIDSNTSTGPWVWELTTAGTTHSSVPSGLTTGTPTPTFSGGVQSASPTVVTDGGASWTCNSLAARQTSTLYSTGQVIVVTWTYVYYTTVTIYFDYKPPETRTIPHDVTYNAFFQCTTAGTTSASGISSWPGALNATISDGGVTWTQIGWTVTRTASATAAVSGGGDSNTVPGNVGDSYAVSNITEIADSNGNGEIIVNAGYSEASAPTWGTHIGTQTTETSGLTWSNQGPFGSANTGVWFYTFTYVNEVTGDESTGAPLSQAILLPASSGILVSGPGSPDTQVSAINIYRTTQQPVGSVSGTPFFLRQIVAPVNSASWSLLDTTGDPPTPGATLNILIIAPGYGIVNGVVTNYNDPPPTGLTNFTFFAGRMWGTVGNINYYSTGPDVTSGNGNTSWNVENFNETPGTQFRLWPTTVGLFTFTNDGLWLVEGLGTLSNPFEEIQPVDPNLSINSYNAFCTAGTQAHIYTSDGLYLTIDPQNGTSWLGQPVATDLAASYDSSAVYVTYQSNGLDQHGFISDGSNHWLSWMSVPAPETGYLWNPPATISAGSGGVGAVISIEVEPGLYKLLIGPSGSGPILARDSSYSAFEDNSNMYAAWAAFGNLVFAHHGQMAGLLFVGADFVRIGSQPVLSVLLDEILGQSGTPSWVQVVNPVNDPPNFPASATIYQLRYWMINTQGPIFCRNGLFKFDFGTDSVKNELYTFTVFGESLTEEIQS